MNDNSCIGGGLDALGSADMLRNWLMEASSVKPYTSMNHPNKIALLFFYQPPAIPVQVRSPRKLLVASHLNMSCSTLPISEQPTFCVPAE